MNLQAVKAIYRAEMARISNSSFAIYFPRFTGTFYEVLSAPVSYIEVMLGFVGAAATKSIIIGSIIFITANFFVSIELAHPFVALLFLVLISFAFCLFGFILGVWADGWEKLTIVPVLVIMPLTFLGGTFYSISMLPAIWQKISLLNPLVYLISGFRWSFYENADVSIALSLAITVGFLLICLLLVRWIFKTGYRIRT